MLILRNKMSNNSTLLKIFFVRIYEEKQQANKQRNKIPLFPGPVKHIQLKEYKLNKMQIYNQNKVTLRY